MMPDPRSARQDWLDLAIVMLATFITTFALLWAFV